MPCYRLVALDVDGTLIGPDNRVPADVADAVAAARRAGLAVCLATGRSWMETVDVWRGLGLAGPFEPMILVGGAIVAEAETGRTLYQKAIDFDTARQFAAALNALGYVAMALVDRWREGVDYLVTERGDHHAASRDWFSKMPFVRVRRVETFDDAPAAPQPLRISTVAEPAAAEELAASLKARFAGRLNVHSILAPNYGVMIVEAHAAGADKLTALKYVAQGLGVGLRRTVAVGDDINDIPMVRGAGLGVAMPSAPPALADVADGTAADGLAAFLRRLAGGQFDPRGEAPGPAG